ncbi:MAG: putative dienelactone hydrolase [Kiritimatiellia bacterium]|jgi:predicted dienelactone hydrolase
MMPPRFIKQRKTTKSVLCWDRLKARVHWIRMKSKAGPATINDRIGRFTGMKTHITLLITLTFSVSTAMAEKAYTPREGTDPVNIQDAEFSYAYNNAQREVPLKLYSPEHQAAALPVILFSHGLGGSRENSVYLGEHWARLGYVVVLMQHAGSDESVWKTTDRAKRLSKMKEAANYQNYMARTADVQATLNQLETWNKKGERLAGLLDLEHVGMSGHSFGAVTTQAVSGQAFGEFQKSPTDARIDAALAMSPSTPAMGKPADAFGSVAIPWLLMTGTKDRSIIRRTTPESRREVFIHLPDKTPDQFYELVFEGAEHMAFSDRTLRGAEHRNPQHHRAILAISTAFWDACLKGDETAVAWLNSDAVRKQLSEQDVWQKK